MKISTALRFVLILIGIGAVIGLIVFAASLGSQKNATGSAGGTGPFSALFPFLGGSGSGNNAGSNGDGGTDQNRQGTPPRLWQVYAGPVSGARFTAQNLIRYIERETGHVYDTEPNSYDSARISNLTVPGIIRVVWAGDDHFVAQSVSNDTVGNVLATIATSAPESALSTTAMGGFARAAASADGTTLLLVTPAGDSSRIETQTIGKAARLALVSPTRSWIPLVSGRDLMLQSAPSSDIPGYLYLLETAGIGAKVAGGIPGLMALPSPDGRYVAVSGASGPSFTLTIIDRKTGKSTPLPVATLAVKCAWFPNGEPRLFCGIPKSANTVTLDGWLLGLGHYTDDAWIIDPVSGAANMALDLADDSGTPIDLVNPGVSPDGAYALFQNKKDLSLWSLRLAP